MKFWNQAWLCLAGFDFEAHNMLSFCFTFQGIPDYRYGKNLTPMLLRIKSEYLLVISIDL